MANSTYFDSVVRCAKEVGIQPPSSPEQFEDDEQLPSPTLKLKLFFDHIQRQLARTLNKKFTERLYTLNTVVGQTTYPLDPSTNIEGIKYHSVRCNTPGSARPLHNLTYNEFRETYTDLTIVPSGRPQIWVAAITPSSLGVERESNIILVPTPDDVYQIEYAAKISAPTLENATDVILFPPEYEDVLWTWAGAMLESKLGIDATMAQYAQSAIDQCRMWSERAVDEKRGIRMGVKLRSGNTLFGSSYDYPDFSRGW